MWRKHGNVSDFVSPQEVGYNPLFFAEENFVDINASSDDEDSYFVSDTSSANITRIPIVRSTVARTESEMINRYYLGRESNVSDFVSPQEVGSNPLFLAEENFVDINAPSDNEDSYFVSDTSLTNLTSLPVVSPTVARTENEMINRFLGREDVSTEDDDISYDVISYENTSEDDISYISRRSFRSSNLSFQTEHTDSFNNRSPTRRYCRNDCGRDIAYPFH